MASCSSNSAVVETIRRVTDCCQRRRDKWPTGPIQQSETTQADVKLLANGFVGSPQTVGLRGRFGDLAAPRWPPAAE